MGAARLAAGTLADVGASPRRTRPRGTARPGGGRRTREADSHGPCRRRRCRPRTARGAGRVRRHRRRRARERRGRERVATFRAGCTRTGAGTGAGPPACAQPRARGVHDPLEHRFRGRPPRAGSVRVRRGRWAPPPAGAGRDDADRSRRRRPARRLLRRTADRGRSNRLRPACPQPSRRPAATPARGAALPLAARRLRRSKRARVRLAVRNAFRAGDEGRRSRVAHRSSGSRARARRPDAAHARGRLCARTDGCACTRRARPRSRSAGRDRTPARRPAHRRRGRVAGRPGGCDLGAAAIVQGHVGATRGPAAVLVGRARRSRRDRTDRARARAHRARRHRASLVDVVRTRTAREDGPLPAADRRRSGQSLVDRSVARRYSRDRLPSRSR